MFFGLPLLYVFFIALFCSSGSPTPWPGSFTPPGPSTYLPAASKGGGLDRLYGLTESEREHLLYGVRGNTPH